ncbi:hypothetical protein AGENTSMITH_185 [Bacillus phage vB_BspM_AgentSmith]|nr:hypothetical protein AGENTSMITH_185 [Bacillus phage vB_BspM_AgentSmith]
MSEYKVIFSNPNLLIYVDLNEQDQRSLYVKEAITNVGFNSRFPHGLTVYLNHSRNKLIFQFTGPGKKRTLCTLNMSTVEGAASVLETYRRFLKRVYDRTTQLYDLSLSQGCGAILYKRKLPFVYDTTVGDKVHFYNPFTKKTAYLAKTDDPALKRKQRKVSKEILLEMRTYRVSHRDVLGSIVYKGLRKR